VYPRFSAENAELHEEVNRILNQLREEIRAAGRIADAFSTYTRGTCLRASKRQLFSVGEMDPVEVVDSCHRQSMFVLNALAFVVPRM